MAFTLVPLETSHLTQAPFQCSTPAAPAHFNEIAPPPNPSTRWTMSAAALQMIRKGAGQGAERVRLALKSSHAFADPNELSPGDRPGTGERDPSSSVGYKVGGLFGSELL